MDCDLPSHLAERTRWVVPPAETAHGPGEYVLYWLHNALRAHENPALDVALCLARQNGLPLLVYHGLCETYPFASDRHHAFILQGARDLQREMLDRGISYAFHLQRQHHRGPHLRDLTRRAAALITEEMPVPPLTGWIERLVTITTTPIACVDSSCLVAAPTISRSSTCAKAYRHATRHLHADQIRRTYPEQAVDCDAYSDRLPFEPLDLQDVDLSTLIAQCRIDHSIAPVADTPGGTRAGYRRWQAFKTNGLLSYDERRHDAACRDSVSRMSAYLHYGMVSPWRLAREAAELHADQYLDELLVQRELAFHFCCHQRDVLDTLEAAPDWAQESLCAHAADPREDDCSWEKLVRARTKDELWNAGQRSLRKHGELHPDVRMTWGKAFLPWSNSPERALRLCLDLNQRYALDGRGPSSYAGVLWCFGQFDRPDSREGKVRGRVRGRSLKSHQRRIDLPRFQSIADRPIARILPTVAVVGSGIAGLIAARTLADYGLSVRLFEKSACVGGRLATWRDEDGLRLDHGAQYFTARDPRFSKYVQSWIQQGIVQPWLGHMVELDRRGKILSEKRGTPRYVGTPDMNTLAQHLAADLDVVLGTAIGSVENGDLRRWRLSDRAGGDLGEFDVVLINTPPAQAAQLIGTQVDFGAEMASVQMRSCWAVMIQGDELDSIGFDAAFLNEGPLSWIARNDAKPGRGDECAGAWVLHGSAEWSDQRLDSSTEEIAEQFVSAFETVIGRSCGQLQHRMAYHWRDAIPSNALDDACLWDPSAGIGVCGDWCGGPRVEGAFLSGMAVAGALLRQLTIDRPAAGGLVAADHATAPDRPSSVSPSTPMRVCGPSAPGTRPNS